jgi:NAD(P)-dependent dehydrogenase (short-subunit alcohol dehydrogenase family)
MDINSLFSLKGRTRARHRRFARHRCHDVEGFIAAGAERIYISRARSMPDRGGRLPNWETRCMGMPLDLSTVEGCKFASRRNRSSARTSSTYSSTMQAPLGAQTLKFPEAGWDKVMDLNVKSLFFLTQALHPLLKAAAFERTRPR